MIESNEKEQVTSQQPTSKQRRPLSPCTTSHGRRVGKVLGRKVRVTRKVDDKQVDDELRDLECGEVLFPPDLEASRGHEVVIVHEDVDGQIGDDWYPGDGSSTVELGVAEEHCC